MLVAAVGHVEVGLVVGNWSTAAELAVIRRYIVDSLAGGLKTYYCASSGLRRKSAGWSWVQVAGFSSEGLRGGWTLHWTRVLAQDVVDAEVGELGSVHVPLLLQALLLKGWFFLAVLV